MGLLMESLFSLAEQKRKLENKQHKTSVFVLYYKRNLWKFSTPFLSA